MVSHGDSKRMWVFSIGFDGSKGMYWLEEDVVGKI
jgi:hypothetical protein